MRPLADRMQISREKLAYIVDSTAAPVAGLALVSTWIAGEIGYIDDGIKELRFSTTSFDALNLFVASIPYRFYVVWALLFVPLTILLGREFGPMATAEERCLRGETADEVTLSSNDLALGGETTRHWSFAALPVAVVVLVTTFLLFTTGLQALDEKTPASLMNIFGNANSYLALVLGSLAGLIASLAMVIPLKAIHFADIRRAAQQGTAMMFPALAILALAWTLSLLTGEEMLGTGIYLGNFVSESISVAWLPTIIFLLASIVAFSTGTSWGTMGILMPLAIAATHKGLLAAGPIDAYDPVFLAAIGSVLSGAIFGDHCSPISDTTVLSSQASGCNHMAHVTTQMPYALAVGAAAILLGTVPIGFGVSVWIMLPVGIAVLAIGLRVCGRRCEVEVPAK
jgi:Na+/H+ antiporter NhaC